MPPSKHTLQASHEKRRDMRLVGQTLAWSGFVVMWAFWICFIVFLADPPWAQHFWPLPTVDSGHADMAPAIAVAIDVALISLFGLQHSVMARGWFKNRVLGAVPQPFERCIFVNAANLVMFALIVLWQPLPAMVWDVPGPGKELIWVVFATGWLILLIAAMSFGIFELLGMSQMNAWCRGKEPRPQRLKSRWLYRVWRHPMYVGLLTAIWATPRMSVGHLLLACGMTVYVLIGVRYEEHDLAQRYGPAYHAWRGKSGQPPEPPP